MNIQGIVAIIAAGVLVVIGCMWGCPQYQVYEQKLTGEAELARATYNRQVKVR